MNETNKKMKARTVFLLLSLLISCMCFAQTAERDSLCAKAAAANLRKDYKTAIDYYKQALKIQKKITGKEHKDYADILTKLADACSSNGYTYNAMSNLKEALAIQEKVSGMENDDYIDVLEDLGGVLFVNGEFNESVNCMKKALALHNTVSGKYSVKYLDCLEILSLIYQSSNRKDDLAATLSEMEDVKKNIPEEAYLSDPDRLVELATKNILDGDYNGALELSKKAVSLFEEAKKTDSEEYLNAYMNWLMCLSLLGEHSQGYEVSKKALALVDKDNPVYYQEFLKYKITNAKSIGYYGEALTLAKESVGYVQKTYGKDNPQYLEALTTLVKVYSTLNNAEEVARLTPEIIELQKKVKHGSTIDEVGDLISLATQNKTVGNNGEAKKLAQEAIQKFKSKYGPNFPYYSAYILQAADVLEDVGETQEAINLYEEIRQLEGGTSVVEIAGLIKLAKLYSSEKRFEEAVKVNREALDIAEKAMSKESSLYIACATNLAWNGVTNCYNLKTDATEYENMLLENMSLYFAKSIDKLQGLTSSDRETLWDDFNNLSNKISKTAWATKSPRLASFAYDASLITKGMLLAAELETKRIIQESNDEELQKLYDAYVDNKKNLAKLLEMPAEERTVDLEALKTLVNKQEQQLMLRSKEFGNLRNNILITWQNVRDKLNADDAAIEFISSDNGDASIYYALVLKKDSEYPKIIFLTKEDKLNIIRPSRYYTTTDVYDIVWKPLASELSGVKNIYFSPSGKLHNINLEILPELADVNNGQNYYRLSSTREIASTHSDIGGTEEAVVYGGLKFNPLASTDAQQSSATRDADNSGWNYLPETLTEATSVTETLEESKVASTLYTGDEGTETSFKALDGAKKKYLHIATHGFYYTDNESADMKNAGIVLTATGSNIQTEDQSLARSGILLAGCNDALTGKSVANGQEDGILYAREIAQMDLRGLDMVTLSACKTGIGDITAEGVFGLQRAFKKAGAKSIMMSLWKVDDEATRIFMTAFYDNYLVKHQSKAVALKEAQKYLRNCENGKFKAPQYWAAFIMLDANN